MVEFPPGTRNWIFAGALFLIVDYVLLTQKIVEINLFYFLLIMFAIVFLVWHRQNIENLFKGKPLEYSLPDYEKESTKIREYLIEMGVRTEPLEHVYADPEFGEFADQPKVLHYIFPYFENHERKRMRVDQVVAYKNRNGLGISSIVKNFISVESKYYSRSGAAKTLKSRITKPVYEFITQPVITAPQTDEEVKQEEDNKDEEKKDDKE